MSCDFDCLMAAVGDAPHDDAPRLACADWYEEHGEPERAEFIRVQLELAGYERWQRPDLTDRAAALLSDNCNWLDWLNGLPTLKGTEYRFERGFPVLVAVNAGAAAAHLRQHPLPAHVRHLRLNGPWGILTLARQPELRQVRHLDILGCGVPSPSTARALRESPHLTGLVGLSLKGIGPDTAAADAVARNSALGHVRALDLSYNRELALPHVLGPVLDARPKIADLKLSRVYPVTRTVQAWGADARFGQLTTLRLNHNRLDSIHVRSLARSPHMAGLIRLELRDNQIGKAGAIALADSPNLEKLTFLDLRDNSIPTAAARRLRERFGSAVLLRRPGCLDHLLPARRHRGDRWR